MIHYFLCVFFFARESSSNTPNAENARLSKKCPRCFPRTLTSTSSSTWTQPGDSETLGPGWFHTFPKWRAYCMRDRVMTLRTTNLFAATRRLSRAILPTKSSSDQQAHMTGLLIFSLPCVSSSFIDCLGGILWRSSQAESPNMIRQVALGVQTCVPQACAVGRFAINLRHGQQSQVSLGRIRKYRHFLWAQRRASPL